MRCKIIVAWAKVWLIILLLHFTAAGIARAQDDDSAGERLFRLHCAECHGLDGQGGRGPDLTRGVYRHGSTDQALYQTIAQGVAGTPTPSNLLFHRPLSPIIKYVRGVGGGVCRAGFRRAAPGGKLVLGEGGVPG